MTKFFVLRVYWAVEGAMLYLFTLYTIYRVMLIFVWKRIIEINEELALRIITMSVYGVTSTATFFMIPGHRFVSMTSATSGESTPQSVFACHQDHPLVQRFSYFANQWQASLIHLIGETLVLNKTFP